MQESSIGQKQELVVPTDYNRCKNSPILISYDSDAERCDLTITVSFPEISHPPEYVIRYDQLMKSLTIAVNHIPSRPPSREHNINPTETPRTGFPQQETAYGTSQPSELVHGKCSYSYKPTI